MSSAAAVTMVEAGRRMARRVCWVMFVANLAVPAIVAGDALVAGDNLLTAFEGERNLMTWFSSLQLLLIAAYGYASSQVLWIRIQAQVRLPLFGVLTWLAFAGGFVLLSLDERFTIHELIRDEVLKPGGVTRESDWVRPGDIVLHVYLLVGVLAAGLLVAELRRARHALACFGAAIGLAAVTVAIDGLPLDVTRALPGGAFWDSAFEEIAEIWAQFLFLVAFARVLDVHLAGLRDAGAGEDGAVLGALLGRAVRLQASLLLAAAAALGVLFPIGYAAFAVAGGNAFWELFRAEYNASEWLSSMLNVLLCLVAAGIAAHEAARTPAAPGRLSRFAWPAAALGFLLFALDERFDGHEAIRDGVIRPLGLFDGLPWLVPGDVVLYGYLLAGVLFCWWQRGDFAASRSILLVTIAALVVAASAVVIDSLRMEALRGQPLWRLLDYAYEELAEIWAELLLLAALICIGRERLLRTLADTRVAR